MLAKLTSKNQLTLPREAVLALGSPTYFDVAVEHDQLILRPTRPGAADAVRRQLAALGITEADVADAVAWAREERSGS